ncbi:hypothetical protein [Hymenobacter antarcticus]|uniref:Tetratricopeptide repeat-containing protein n=1 Tax=Hymenobacter antarcticus TaxID=486270 RepID=A0ABP7R2J3_9BACT
MSYVKKCWSVIALLLLLLASQSGHAQWKMVNDDCAFPTSKRYFNSVADENPVTDADLDHPRKSSPKAKFPLPQPHAAEVAQSEQDYNAGRFAKAAEHLKPFINQKLVAPRLLNQYARALYRVPGGKPQSYIAYQRLIALLDSYGHEDAATCAIYLPFSEAYYKLATLQMDNDQWKLAAYNLSRFLYILNMVPAWKANGIYESALQYQTECFAEMGNPTLCRQYGKRTLKLFPRNEYVGAYMARLPPVPKPKS